jgi:hypothetical protein
VKAVEHLLLMESALLSGRLDCTCGIQIDGVTVGCGAVVDCSAFGFPAASILSDAATIPSYEVAAKATAVFTFKSEGGKEQNWLRSCSQHLDFTVSYHVHVCRRQEILR